ncbi:MAG: hypothetical protein EXQ86_08505 [Rhodospirillales bacterium]|nr:hypothetical protein [Rhodospirillales bacterium]
MSFLYAVLTLVAAQRFAELALARWNTRRLFAAGAVEAGAGHYPLIVALHAAWIVAIAVLVPADAPASVPLLGAFFLLQGARLWVIASLGRFWTTRIVTLPGAPLIRRGPYRFIRHPNYLVVALEIPLLPLAFGVGEIALVFGLANTALLWHRMRVEDTALDPRAPSDIRHPGPS